MSAKTAVMVVCLATGALPAAGQGNAGYEISASKLAEKVIIVTDGGMASQLAVNAKAGIVVFDTGYCTGVAAALRERIEREFGRSDFAAVVLTNQRLDYVGGGKAYAGVPVIAQERAARVLARQQQDPAPYLQPLIDMWRWKEGVSRDRLPSHPAGSPQAAREENWMNTCRRMADDLASDYELVPPTRTFADRLELDLGDMTLILQHFGVGSRGEAGMVARIPELKLVLFGRLLFHEQHMLPYLNCRPWQDLDVERTLSVLDEILAEPQTAQTVIVTSGPWDLQEIRERRRYLGDLRRLAQEAAARGATAEQAVASMSVDSSFTYLKEWPVWRNQGAEWCEQEHAGNVMCLWGQFQRFAAREILDACRRSGPEAALVRYDALTGAGTGDFLVDARSFDSLTEALFNEGFATAAAAVAERNVQVFPDSWPVHFRLGEALLARGERDAALASFRKVLELDPGNAGAAAKVERLQGS